MVAEPARPVAWSGEARISGPQDIARVLAEVTSTAQRRDRTSAMAQPVQSAEAAGSAGTGIGRVLPAVPEFADLLAVWSGGLQRGATVAVTGSASTVMVLLAGAMSQGSWAAVVGMPNFGALAANELGVPLDRLALVPVPGPDWPTAVSALIDGLDVVVVETPAGASENTLRALMRRARNRGCVLVPTAPWPGCDLTIELTGRRWLGLGIGHGRLRSQQVSLRSVGRGAAARPRTVNVTLPPPSIAGVPATFVIPPPPAAASRVELGDTAHIQAPECDPVANLLPVDPPVDPWAGIVGQVSPRPGRQRSPLRSAAD